MKELVKAKTCCNSCRQILAREGLESDCSVGW